MKENDDSTNKSIEQLLIKENIKKSFFELFCEKGYSSSSYFDFGVWFMKRHHVNENFQKDFEEILMRTPSDNDDIIQSTLIRGFLRSKNLNAQIKVVDYVEELAENLINLHMDSKRVEKLIKNYNAYETKNTIELNLEHYEKFMKVNYDLTKSNISAKLESVQGLYRGDYKVSLIVSFYNEVNMREIKLEYKLNNLLKINEEDLNFSRNNYAFPLFEFFSFESKISEELKKYESGTNLLYFQIKIENLGRNYDDISYSEKKTLLDLFLTNIDSTLDNIKQVKIFRTEFKFEDMSMNVKMDIEFDPYTLSSVYNRISSLLQDIISFKVLVEHKYKTILNYFPEIAEEVEQSFKPKEKESGCLIY